MSIILYTGSISDSTTLLEEILINEFDVEAEQAKNISNQDNIKRHFSRLKDSCYLVGETNYVDKVYRDSYYSYYSSKLARYHRDCVRISIFEGSVKPDDFHDENTISILKGLYRGFIVIRPTIPYIIGRSIISPRALKTTNLLCCSSLYHNTVNGIKMEVEGFPHSSQDTETITCAETTLWAMMEYFGNRYSHYKPVLPSQIIQTLNKISSERQIPSKGLNVQQMSFALKEFGFGTRIYHHTKYRNFFNLLSCYIESGIPVIVSVENREGKANVGHALLCIGHEGISPTQIDQLEEHFLENEQLQVSAGLKHLTIYDHDDIDKHFVFMDDNFPAYQTADLDDPTIHYKDQKMKDCKIKYFIAPLYTKIHLEAYEAKNFIYTFLIDGPIPLINDSEVLLRVFLTSSRSFKDRLSVNTTFNSDLKSLILEKPLPKFIWVAELSNKALIKQRLANGVVILDATEANINYNKPLILAAYQDNVINFENSKGVLENKVINLSSFSIYENNLKSF